MRRALLVALLLVLAAPAHGAGWGLIEPGRSTMDAVRERYGAASKVERPKVDGYDTEDWTYEGPRAPAGMQRMVVQFGLVDGGVFRKNVVRAFRLEPSPGAFHRNAVEQGWGVPDRVGKDGGADIYFYQDGLLVYFDPRGVTARLMIFTLPQPPVAPPATPKP